MTFSKGSLVVIDYTAKVKDTGEVFETTSEEEAKKHSLHETNIKYQPKLVSIGELWIIKGVDEALEKTSVGDKKTIEVTPDKGFGERDTSKIRKLGWENQYNSKEAMSLAIDYLIKHDFS